MISFFRKIINSRIGALLALIFVAMIGIGFALGDVTGRGTFGGLGDSNIAKVGGDNITLGEFTQAAEVQLRQARQKQPTLDKANFIAGGGYESTLLQLINRYALAVFGDKYGIAASKRLIDSEILKIPGARGLDGSFSPEAFQAFAANLGVSEQMIRDDIKQNFYAQQMYPTAAAGAPAPKSLVLPYASLMLEKRAGQVAVIPSVAFLPKAPPTDAQLNDFYKSHVANFTIPEKRAINYALFDKSIVTEKAEPTAEEIAAYYKTNAAKYAASETRDFSQIVVPTQSAAVALAAKANGKSFTALASEMGLSALNSSAITREALTVSASKAVSDAVFATPSGAIATPAKGGLGWYVIRVTGTHQIAARPLAAVSAEISAALATDKAAHALADLTSDIEDEFAGGTSLAEVAKTQGLKVETSPKLIATGQDLANPNYKPIDAMKVILPAAFQMEKDGDAQLVEIVPGEKFALVSIAALDPAAPPPLASVKDNAMKLWALSEGSKASKIAADKVRAAVTSGKSLADAVASLGIRLPAPQTVSGSRADLNKEGQKIAPPVAMLFAMKKGTAKSIAAPNSQGWFVVHLNDIIKGDASTDTVMLDARRSEMTQLLRDEYAAQLINAAGADVGVKKNQAALDKLKKSASNPDSGQ